MRTITGRARAFRPVLLGVVLFWVAVFAAYAAECSPSSWTLQGVWWTSPSTSDFCAWYDTATVDSKPSTCVVAPDASSASTSYTTFGTSYSETWSRDAGACEEDEESEPWVELDLLHAIVGALWFFSLMHGFTVGRVSA